MMKRPAAWIAIAACLWFVLSAQPFLPRLGMENDEAWLAAPIYLENSALYYLWVGHFHAPLMLTNHIGTLKTFLWWPLFAIFGTGVWVLREPAVLAGAATIWLFFLLLRRIAGERAAVIGVVLLAADPLYILLSCYDFGPEVLQQLLLLSALLLSLHLLERKNDAALAGSALLIGLALWNKAIVVWTLSGLGVATLMFYRRAFWAAFTRKRAILAALWLVVGMWPLVLFNIHSRLGTLRGNVAPDNLAFSVKAKMLLATFDGSALYGWLSPIGWATPYPHAPSTVIERISAAIAAGTGDPSHHWIVYGFALALLLAPLAARREIRIILFCVVAMAIAWAQMAWNTNSGATANHTILLWPLPQAIIGISFAAASRRARRAGIPVLAAAVGVLAISCTLVTNEYYATMVRYGGSNFWTTAIDPLADYLEMHPAPAVFIMDWGFRNDLALMARGQLPLQVEMGAHVPQPGAIYVAHVPGMEFFPEINAKFVDYAARHGYHRDVLKVISDDTGRPMFEVYKISK